MSYVDVYRMIFTNDKGDDVIIHISDTTSGEGASTYHDMKDSAGEWLTMAAKISSANDGEDKLSPIRSIRFSCTFISTSTYNIDFFIQGEDNRWLIEVFLLNPLNPLNPPIFKGFLVPEGAKEVFLDPELFGVELTASDGLPTISDRLLRKTDTTIPKGKFTLIQYIAWCLENTFLPLPIKVVYNLREESLTGPDDCFLKLIYEDAYSFETDINEREDCLTVLKRILLGCIITQVNGEWWVVRVDEMDSLPYRIYSFASDATYLGVSSADYVKRVGINENINFIGEDAQIYPERQVQFAQQTFKFETWQEIICNIKYDRGTFNGVIVANQSDYLLTYATRSAFPGTGDTSKVYKATDTGIYYRWDKTFYQQIQYSAIPYYPIECWTGGKNFHGTPATPESVAYIRKKTINGYEEERVLVIPTTTTGPHFLKSSQVVVNKLDKFFFSVDRRLNSDHTGTGVTVDQIFMIRLYGDDGSYWVMCGNSDTRAAEGSWLVSNSSWFIWSTQDFEYKTSTTNEMDWSTHSVEVFPVPVSGRVEILLLQSEIYATVNDTHFANIQFEYIPIIDGVYQKVTGQINKVSNTDNRKSKIDEQIFISEAASPQWKGVLFTYNGIGYPRIGNVYDYRLGTSGGLGLTRFSKWQIFALWNQHNRTIRKIQSNIEGLETNTGLLPTFIHKFWFTDPSQATDNKLYQMLSFDMDLATCQWSGTFADVFDLTVGKDYSSTHEFKYTTK